MGQKCTQSAVTAALRSTAGDFQQSNRKCSYVQVDAGRTNKTHTDLSLAFVVNVITHSPGSSGFRLNNNYNNKFMCKIPNRILNS